MNASREKDTETLRSDINTTRARMDDTMDQLGERLEPRHLIDEVLGFFRHSSESPDGSVHRMREKVSRSADAAMHAIVDTVKQNPMPALLIGAGVAWMIYESRRDRSTDKRDESDMDAREREGIRYEPDLYHDRPLQYPEPTGDEMKESLSEKERLSEKASGAAEKVKEKIANVGEEAREKFDDLKERAGEKLHNVRERAGEMTAKVGRSTRRAYNKTRDQIATTADEHPLEVGLACLAGGLIAGLLIPTPAAVNRVAGPTADRLRERAREAGSEMLEKTQRVARAATNAAKDEANEQGLLQTPAPEGGQKDAGNQSGSEARPFAPRPEASGTGI